jgi:hypothetical protein
MGNSNDFSNMFWLQQRKLLAKIYDLDWLIHLYTWEPAAFEQ